MIPRIEERKITKLRKPGGITQYVITLPKEYAKSLEERGVNSLLIVFNHALAGFPAKDELSEEAIVTFLKTHPKLMRLFAPPASESSKKKSEGEEEALR